MDLFKSRPLAFRNYPFGWLLLLCDLLQEWLRPAGNQQDGAMDELFTHAKQHEMVLDSGPRLFVSYPEEAGDIGNKLRHHLTFFGEHFMRDASG